MNKGRILIVDDDQFYQEFCSEVLKDEGYQIRTTFTGEEALAYLNREAFDIMLVDLIMPGMEGFEVLERAKQLQPAIDVVVMTGYASVESAVHCLKAGARDYLTKPLNPEELKITVKRAIELRHLFDENLELKNLLTLYETCQRVSSCLDLERLYGLSLDAILLALKASAGLCAFSTESDAVFELKAFRGMEDDDARAILEVLKENELARLTSHPVVIESPSISKENQPGHHLRIGSMIIIPLQVKAGFEGAIVIFGKLGQAETLDYDHGTAHFIADQVLMSFQNTIGYQEARHLMFVDDLTNLFNTRYLDHALQTEIKRARRYKKHLSLLFVDLDFFKEVNDNFGHLAGSKVLIDMAAVLKSCLREIDIVTRYGGDEFIVILIETDRPGAQVVAERIRTATEKHPFRIREGTTLHLTCCVGIATFPEDADNKTDLIYLADKAMYRGKETTRNVVYAASSL
jgi:two-component system cell cycle response regulator